MTQHTEKLKANVFDGLDMKTFIKDGELFNLMNDLELRVQTSFVDVMKNYLGNHWVENYKKLMENLLKILQDVCANMFIKVHFLNSHLDKIRFVAFM